MLVKSVLVLQTINELKDIRKELKKLAKKFQEIEKEGKLGSQNLNPNIISRKQELLKIINAYDSRVEDIRSEFKNWSEKELRQVLQNKDIALDEKQIKEIMMFIA